MLNQKVRNNTAGQVQSTGDPSEVANVVSNAVKLSKAGSQVQLAQQPDSRFESSYQFHPTSISALTL